jgi:hypothetical protein
MCLASSQVEVLWIRQRVEDFPCVRQNLEMDGQDLGCGEDMANAVFGAIHFASIAAYTHDGFGEGVGDGFVDGCECRMDGDGEHSGIFAWLVDESAGLARVGTLEIEAVEGVVLFQPVKERLIASAEVGQLVTALAFGETLGGSKVLHRPEDELLVCETFGGTLGFTYLKVGIV